jgi:hypothetical protein
MKRMREMETCDMNLWFDINSNISSLCNLQVFLSRFLLLPLPTSTNNRFRFFAKESSSCPRLMPPEVFAIAFKEGTCGHHRELFKEATS